MVAATFEKLRLSSGETINLTAWHADPSASRAVVYLHGVESHSQWFARTAESLTTAGVSVYGFDRSGWGQSSGRRGHLTSATSALQELDQVLQVVSARHSSVHLVGMSWGGLFALYYALRTPHKLASLTLIAPGIVPRKDLSVVEKINVIVGRVFGGRWNLDLGLTPADFTSLTHWQSYIAKDEYRITKVSSAFCMATYQMRRSVIRGLRDKKILPPTNVLLAEHDSVINNWATIELLRHEQVRIISYEQAAHSLIFEDPSRVARDVSRLVFAVPIAQQTA